MIGIGAMLAGVGIDFVKDLITDNGEDLVKEGIKKVTGIDLNKKKELTPAEIQAIRDSEVKLRELDYKELELEAKDRDSARQMQVAALSQEDLFSKRFVYYYASFITFVSFAYIFFITFGKIPEANVRFADTILGFLLGVGLSNIIVYFFGSSKGSRDKTDALLNASKK
ncbi:MAG: hypothetical protein PHW89_08060 [Sulfurimonas denitrificans]|nr:hypothetical protein [Sulfurimonas denitrificans]